MSKGYKRLKRNGKCIDEHRLIWEQVNGPIPDGFEIHHINGLKADNCIENLQLKEISAHRREHSTKNHKCSIESCDNRNWSRGYCKKHWYRWHRTGDPLGLKGHSSTNPLCNI